MARQRFIHPELWDDPVFGRLKPDLQVLFIGLFSLADDDGRISADPSYLRSNLYTYKDAYTSARVRKLRDELCDAMPNVHLYEAGGLEYVSLLKWRDYQKPKYPKASKIPPPFPQASPKPSGSLPHPFHDVDTRVGLGLGRDGMGGVVEVSEQHSDSIFQKPKAARGVNAA